MKMVYVDGNFIDSNTFEEIEKQKQQKRRQEVKSLVEANYKKAKEQPNSKIFCR